VPREAVFRPGGRYLVRAFDREGMTVASAAFRILSPSEAADLAREEARVDGLFPEGSAEREFARAELALARGLAGEAEAAAGRLAARFPGRREPARLGLAALEALGLAGSPDGTLRRAAYDAGR
jgi:hypothetical protein